MRIKLGDKTTMKFDENTFVDKYSVVLGVGVSNRPLIKYLLSHGAKIEVRDKKSIEKLGEYGESLIAQGIKVITGDDYLENIKGDFIFRSPGIRPDLGSIPEAIQNGAYLTSEMELFMELCPCPVFAISGSDGKTTSSTLTAKLLESTGRRVYLGGNIGTPLLPFVEQMNENDVVVLELSSFQLMTFTKSANYTAITNISPNHLDWHIDMQEYIDSKANIFKFSENKKLILNANNGQSEYYASLSSSPIEYFSAKRDADICLDPKGEYIVYKGERILKCKDILIPGIHNVENYMTAIILTKDFGVTKENINHIAKTFPGVEHRLEFVREFEGVRYYNSSIDSSPSRTAAALSAIGCNPIVICGGYDKMIPFAPLAESLNKHAKAVVLTGATAQKIKAALDESNSKLPIYMEEDFDEALLKAKAIASEGDTVLLSPACASFDKFDNFEIRGRYFKDKVNNF